MLYSYIHLIIGLGMLEQSATASPHHLDPVPRKPNLSPRQDNDRGLWPPHLIDWPFPANISEGADTQPRPKDSPVGTTTTQNDEVYARSEISKAYMDKSCTSEVRQTILSAWEGARILVDAQTKQRPNYDFNTPHTHWLGKEWNNETVWSPLRKKFRQRIQENFSRINAVFSREAPKFDYIYFTCSDPRDFCVLDDGTKYAAYQYSYNDRFWSNHYINFCDPWKDLPTLHEQKEWAKSRRSALRVMDYFEGTRDGVLFHEMWHMKNLVSVPQAVDAQGGYHANGVWDLAKNKGTWYSTVNADSYHLDAVAIHIQQHFGSSQPPIPYRELQKLDPKAFAAAKAAVNEPPREIFKTAMLPPLNSDKSGLPNKDIFDEITYDIWPDTKKADPACTRH